MSSLSLLAIPAEFIHHLKHVEAKEGEAATLTCEYSLPGVHVHWKKGFESIKPGDKYVMKQRKTINSLTIKALKPEDAGQYTCQCRDHHTTASLKVHGKALHHTTNSPDSALPKTSSFLVFTACELMQV